MATPDSLRIHPVDLAAGPPAAGPREDGHGLYLSIWWREVPLGVDELNDRGLPPRALADRVAHLIAGPVGDRLFGRGFGSMDPYARLAAPDDVPELAPLLAVQRPLARFGAIVDGAQPPPLPRVSLVICTRERPHQLQRCLTSVQGADPQPDEVIVVDNAPSKATAAVVSRFAGFRYIGEAKAGLSAARNAGIRAAHGDVIAFVDDDTEVRARWLQALCAPFADPEVMATTGLVLPAELETPAQRGFEKLLGGFARGFHRLSYGPAFFARTRRFGVPVWKVGAGANMALRREAFDHVDLFDERLGAGASGCSEDSELWYRLLAAGWTCRYEPGSVVVHHHRDSAASLRYQAHEYIRGHVAALFVQYGRYGHVGDLRRALVHVPRSLLHKASRELIRRALWNLHVVPPQLAYPALSELTGYLRGLRYLPVAMDRRTSPGKAPLRTFLAGNPYTHPLTEGFFYREKMRAIHRVSPDTSPSEILEVGGGQSGMARMLYPRARVTVLDADPVYSESAVNQDPAVMFVHGDATRLPFGDASFDIVTLFDVLEHIDDDRAAVSEAWRVVRPGGYILVSSPNERWRSPYHRVMRPICPSDEDMIERWGHVRRGYMIADYTALFGTPPTVRADFINRITVVAHDLAFSRLPERVRRALLVALSPVTWAGYLLQPRGARGTETAARWRRPAT